MTDPLVQELESATQRPSCKACATFAEMTEERRNAINTALSGKMGAERLAGILKKNGVDVGRTSLVRHRREGHSE